MVNNIFSLLGKQTGEYCVRKPNDPPPACAPVVSLQMSRAGALLQKTLPVMLNLKEKTAAALSERDQAVDERQQVRD